MVKVIWFVHLNKFTSKGKNMKMKIELPTHWTCDGYGQFS